MPDISPVVAVIQARMSSSRLPGKVLMDVAGKPLLWHIVHRLRKCRSIDVVAVATSTDPRDDAIAEFCVREAVPCIRGSLDNVLDRYRLAAEQTGAKTLLRVTGDSPLIDPGFVDHMVGAFAQGDFDYVQLQAGALCAHEGVDVFSRRALDWLIANAGNDPIAQEHVTSYFKRVPGAVNTAFVPEYKPLAREYARLSVDTADDLAFVRAVYEKLQALAGEVLLEDVLQLMREEPAYRQINAHVRQKPMDQVERHALICCQGGRQAGLGHVRRSLALARALRDQEGFGVTIGVHGDAQIMGMVRAASFEAVSLEHRGDLVTLAGARQFALAIVDVKDWLARADVADLARRIPTVAVIDDGSERRMAATHAYYPPVPQARDLSWAGSACKPRIGWEWCVLGFDPALVVAAKEPHGPSPRIVVSMGGADPHNKTSLALEALKQLSLPFEAEFIIGPAFANIAATSSAVQGGGENFRALIGVPDPAAIFARADLALIAFGVTAYEVAALGIPAVYVPVFADHPLSASAFTAAGMGIALPQHASASDFFTALSGLLQDGSLRRKMAETGPRLLDGKGAGRIAAELARAVEGRA